MKKALAALVAAALISACGKAAPAASPQPETTAAAEVSTGTETAAPEEKNELHTVDMPATGISLTLPQDIHSLKGFLISPSDIGEKEVGSGVVFGLLQYLARTHEEMDEYQNLLRETDSLDTVDEATQEKLNSFYTTVLPVFAIIGVNNSRTCDDVAADLLGNVIDVYGTPSEIGEKNGYRYYHLGLNFDNPKVKATLDSFQPDLRQEYLDLSDDIKKHPEYFELKQPKSAVSYPEPGTKISFTAQDLDGNPVSSDDLFAKSDYTMVNIWRTWCDPCLNEFPDIMKLEQEFKDRGLAVVTYCGNAGDEKTIEEAKQIIGEYSFSANLAASDEFNKALPWNATPITYFVDREGKVVASPFLGANIRKCREIAESLVSGTAPEAPSVTDISEDAGKEKTYSVHVNDQNGDAVKGAVVSFCTDTDCNIAETDEAGIASFTGPSYPYHIQIIQVPDEYRYDSEFAAAMDDDESTMTVTIEKK